MVRMGKVHFFHLTYLAIVKIVAELLYPFFMSLKTSAILPPDYNLTILRFRVFKLGYVMMLLVQIKNVVKAFF